MRNGTKLKHILKAHTIDVAMQDSFFTLTTVTKNANPVLQSFRGTTWSSVVNKAYAAIQK